MPGTPEQIEALQLYAPETATDIAGEVYALSRRALAANIAVNPTAYVPQNEATLSYYAYLLGDGAAQEGLISKYGDNGVGGKFGEGSRTSYTTTHPSGTIQIEDVDIIDGPRPHSRYKLERGTNYMRTTVDVDPIEGTVAGMYKRWSRNWLGNWRLKEERALNLEECRQAAELGLDTLGQSVVYVEQETTARAAVATNLAHLLARQRKA